MYRDGLLHQIWSWAQDWGAKPSARPDDARYDGMNHLVERVKDHMKRRCAGFAWELSVGNVMFDFVSIVLQIIIQISTYLMIIIHKW